ncbi:MAG TPA: redox-regulated ATPase YchF [Planctomycetota bacterium]|nr:redox-regulated ATPase YchF [Planctomycetota bacterium]
MGFNCGLVGLPTVGKSTIFNALTMTQVAQAANYPFCTIDPNSGIVTVPDKRLWVLKDIVKTNRVIPVKLELVDIVGLVRGSSTGQGKGNSFLGAIKGVDALLHVVRCFEDPNVVHVDGKLDPVRDIETIDMELILKDEETVKTKLERCAKRKSDKEAMAAVPVLEKALKGLNEFIPVRAQKLSADELAHLADCHLITQKPVLFVCNIGENDIATNGNAHSKAVFDHAAKVGARAILISGKIEAELVSVAPDERRSYMEMYGMQEGGLDRLVHEGYDLLGLGTYLTAGEIEVRAWQIQKGWKAPRAAGVIHTDFEKGFIRAEVASYDDFVHYKGEKGCRAAGKLRTEGKDYVVQDGDVMHFLFNK